MALPPVPRFSSVLSELNKGAKGLFAKIHYDWDAWFQVLAKAIGLSSQQVGSLASTAQTAAISTTAITPTTTGNVLSAGLYAVTYAMDVTRAAAVSSSLALTLTWTYNAVSRTFTGATITNGSTSSTQGAVVPMNVDPNTSITYATSYASSGSPSMQYALTLKLEQVP